MHSINEYTTAILQALSDFSHNEYVDVVLFLLANIQIVCNLIIVIKKINFRPILKLWKRIKPGSWNKALSNFLLGIQIYKNAKPYLLELCNLIIRLIRG